MNALYCMLCEIAFEEANQSFTSDGLVLAIYESSATPIENMAYNVCQIAGNLNFSASNTSDIYTLSLAEVLLQLVFLSRSDALLHYILDVLWPQLEKTGRGYEHSHYPTQLVKRIIAQIAVFWENNRVILLIR
ncbi:hypothetical protein EYZ11_007047 [Aspergillus tanneri]|uniref:Uncharacterized protein n=1 Tax=Aspergillus tanneri TaxID=1220188 RepID=A0A4S3JE91_9EURO|nr:hypothetical protein EYZ11_007047 [Aspergillus tanneri]